MLMCTRCKKRPAVVFVSNGVDGQPTQGGGTDGNSAVQDTSETGGEGTDQGTE